MNSATRRYDQLIRDLKSDYRPQRQWVEGRGLFLVIGHYLVGVAAGTWLLARYYGVNDVLLAALVIAALGGLAHLVNLHRPERFLKMMYRVRTSWVARGFWGLVLFLLGAPLFLLPQLFSASPWSADSLIARAGDIISVTGAVILVGYMGFVYAESRGIALWNSALHPVLYIMYSARSGVAGLLIFDALQSRPVENSLLEFWLVVTGVVVALWAVDLRMAYTKGNEAARRSVHELLAGRVAAYVYGGILLVGIVLPALLLAGAQSMSALTLAVIGVASVIGDFFIKYSTVKAGIHKRVRVPFPSSARSY
jgi:formate-dependent nitrite reductase membrane component NrfD